MFSILKKICVQCVQYRKNICFYHSDDEIVISFAILLGLCNHSNKTCFFFYIKICLVLWENVEHGGMRFSFQYLKAIL